MDRNYRQLGSEEWAFIEFGLTQSMSLRSMAEALGRAPSTVSRELARNGWHNPVNEPVRRGRPRIAGSYRAARAQRRIRRCRWRSRRQCKLVPGTWLRDRVVELLKTGHAPEQVSAMLRSMHPDDDHAQISHETIYTTLYALPRGTDRRGEIPDRASIHVQPPEVDDRTVPGHWEGDLIKGAANASAVGTLVERTTLFVSLAQVDNAGTDAAVTGFSRVLNRIDSQLRRSLTYDQGK